MSTESTGSFGEVFDEITTPAWVDEEQQWIRRYDHESELGAWVRISVLRDGGRQEEVLFLETVSSSVLN